MRQGDESNSQDRYVNAIDNVEQSARAAHDALDEAVEAFTVARQERLAGLPHAEIVRGLLARGGGDSRRRADEACREFIAALSEFRAVSVRMMVDEDGMTLSDVARLAGVSRQMIARVYRGARTSSVSPTSGG
jgi:hypothetical protein